MTVSPNMRDPDATGVARWLFAGTLALGLHVLVAWAALFTVSADTESAPNGALTIELAPLAVARAELPAEVPNGPDQVRSEAAPEAPPSPREPKIETPREEPVVKQDEAPELVKVQDPEAMPPAEPEKKPEQERPASPPAAPSVAVPTTSAVQVDTPLKGPQAVAVQKGTTGRPSATDAPAWARRLSEILEKNKRYPKGAQVRREQGVVQIAFMLDRSGALVAARIARSSGSAELDQEALELLARAAPFPPPPAEIPGERLEVVVPLHFKLK